MNIDFSLLAQQKLTLLNVIEQEQKQHVKDDLTGILHLIDAVQDKYEPEPKTIEFTRVKRDINGNSRYVCHFLNFITDKDDENGSYNIAYKYSLALKRAKQLGGKKFHNKQYRGGIVFQTTNPKEIEQAIFELLNETK